MQINRTLEYVRGLAKAARERWTAEHPGEMHPIDIEAAEKAAKAAELAAAAASMEAIEQPESEIMTTESEEVVP